MSSTIHLDQFEHHVEFLDNNFSNDCNSSNWIPSAYPGVVMNIVLTRNIGYHLLQTYLPSTFFVILGKQFSSKWPFKEAIFCRLFLLLHTSWLNSWQSSDRNDDHHDHDHNVQRSQGDCAQGELHHPPGHLDGHVPHLRQPLHVWVHPCSVP